MLSPSRYRRQNSAIYPVIVNGRPRVRVRPIQRARAAIRRVLQRNPGSAAIPNPPLPPGATWPHVGEGLLHQQGRAAIRVPVYGKTDAATTNAPFYAYLDSVFYPVNAPPASPPRKVRATFFDAPPLGLRLGQPWVQILSLPQFSTGTPAVWNPVAVMPAGMSAQAAASGRPSAAQAALQAMPSVQRQNQWWGPNWYGPQARVSPMVNVRSGPNGQYRAIVTNRPTGQTLWVSGWLPTSDAAWAAGQAWIDANY